MLILSRFPSRGNRKGQAIVIDHPAGLVTVRVLEVNYHGQVKLGITAPDEVEVWREEATGV